MFESFLLCIIVSVIAVSLNQVCLRNLTPMLLTFCSFARQDFLFFWQYLPMLSLPSLFRSPSPPHPSIHPTSTRLSRSYIPSFISIPRYFLTMFPLHRHPLACLSLPTIGRDAMRSLLCPLPPRLPVCYSHSSSVFNQLSPSSLHNYCSSCLHVHPGAQIHCEHRGMESVLVLGFWMFSWNLDVLCNLGPTLKRRIDEEFYPIQRVQRIYIIMAIRL